MEKIRHMNPSLAGMMGYFNGNGAEESIQKEVFEGV